VKLVNDVEANAYSLPVFPFVARWANPAANQNMSLPLFACCEP
jgi:hypothetical protein